MPQVHCSAEQNLSYNIETLDHARAVNLPTLNSGSIRGYQTQVLALIQMHPKESHGRVIHDSKVVRCLKMWDTGFIGALYHRYLSMIN